MKEVMRCLFLPIKNKTLMLPFSSVAEVRMLENFIPDDKNSWIIGQCEWRGQKIPVLSLEKLDQDTIADNTSQEISKQISYIAILNRISPNTPAFTAIQITGTPFMSRLRASDLTKVNIPTREQYFMEVLFRGARYFIPNVEWIEKEAAEYFF